MNKHLCLIIIALFTYSKVASQQRSDYNKKVMSVLNEKTKQPVEYASVSINRTRYLSTNNKGILPLKDTGVNRGDTVRISCVGFDTKIYIIGSKTNVFDTVYLSPTVYSLNEVVLTATKPRNVVFGNSKFSIGAHITRLNRRYALYIPNKDSVSGIIKELNFIVKNVSKGARGPFKINVYSRSKINQFPDKELIDDDLVVRSSKGNGKVTVDIKKYHLQIPPDGFFIVAETLSQEYYSDKPKRMYGEAYLRTPGFSFSNTQKEEGFYSVCDNGHGSWHVFDFPGDKSSNLRFTATVQVVN